MELCKQDLQKLLRHLMSQQPCLWDVHYFCSFLKQKAEYYQQTTARAQVGLCSDNSALQLLACHAPGRGPDPK